MDLCPIGASLGVCPQAEGFAKPTGQVVTWYFHHNHAANKLFRWDRPTGNVWLSLVRFPNQPTRNVNSRTWTWLCFLCQMGFLQNIFLSIRDGWLFAKLDIFPLRPTWLERTERANMRLWKRRKRWFWFRQPTISRLRLKENDKYSRSRRWRRSPGGWRRPWDWFKDVRSLSDLSLGLGSSYVSINIFIWITFILFLIVFSSHIPFPSSWWCLEKHRVNQHESHGL